MTRSLRVFDSKGHVTNNDNDNNVHLRSSSNDLVFSSLTSIDLGTGVQHIPSSYPSPIVHCPIRFKLPSGQASGIRSISHLSGLNMSPCEGSIRRRAISKDKFSLSSFVGIYTVVDITMTCRILQSLMSMIGRKG